MTLLPSAFKVGTTSASLPVLVMLMAPPAALPTPAVVTAPSVSVLPVSVTEPAGLLLD